MTRADDLYVGYSSESAQPTSDLSARDQWIYVIGALAGVHDLNVIEVFNHTILNEDAIASKNLSSQSHNFSRLQCGLCFCPSYLRHRDLCVWLVHLLS